VFEARGIVFLFSVSPNLLNKDQGCPLPIEPSATSVYDYETRTSTIEYAVSRTFISASNNRTAYADNSSSLEVQSTGR
jgi:hypothetical protein